MVGIVGTAPDATVDGAFGDGTDVIFNQPFKLNTRADAPTADLGSTGSLPQALNQIYRQGNVVTQMVIVQHESNLTDAARIIAERQHFEGSSADLTGVWALTVADPKPTIVCIGDEVSNRRLPDVHNSRLFSLEVLTTLPTGSFTFTSQITNLVITKGAAVNVQFPLVTGAFSYSLANLARLPGLTFNATTRRLVGTMTTDLSPTLFTYTAQRTSGTPLTRVRTFTIMTVDDPDPNDITFASLPVNITLEVGTQMANVTMPLPSSAGGEVLTISIGGLPAGLTYNTNNRRLRGTPTVASTARGYSYSVQGADLGANTVASELLSVADALKAIAVIDGPNGTQAEAIAKAGDFGSARAYLVDPGVTTADGKVLSSPSVAGLMAVTPFWESPSNRILQGVVGTGRLIDRARAQALNDDYIATIIRRNGFRLWGNETVDSVGTYRFVNIQRTADAIEASLVDSHLYAIDRNISARYFETVALGVNQFLAKLTSQGAISGGVCYPDDSKNTVASIQAGEVFFQIEWSGSYPAQTLNINMELSGRFLEELLANINV